MLLASCLLLFGGSCDLSAKLDFKSPISLPAPDPEAPAKAAASIRLEPGLGLTVRPSYLGVTGTVSDVFGAAAGATEAVVTESGSGGAVALEWRRGDIVGTIVAERPDGGAVMYLPAFWSQGESRLEGNGVIWLGPGAYRKLADTGEIDWSLGLPAEAAAMKAEKILADFNRIAASLSGAGAAAPASPFAVKLKGEAAAFPVRVDGRIEHVRALLASGWFADYVILKNPSNPLILKVSVNPLALSALDAFKALGADPRAVGYEITAIALPKAK